MQPVQIYNEAHVARLSDTIARIYESAFDSTPWQSVLDELTQSFPGICAAIAGYDANQGLPVFVQSAFEPEALEQYLNEMWMMGEPMKYVMAYPEGSVLSDDIIAPEIYEEMYFVKNWLLKFGIKHSSAVVLAKHEDRHLAMTVGYPIGREDELRPQVESKLRLLTPHIISAMNIARIVSAQRIVAQNLRGMVDAISLPMMILREDGKMLFANEEATAFLGANEGLSLDPRGHLKTDLSCETSKLCETLSLAATKQITRGQNLATVTGDLTLCMVPLPAFDVAGSELDRALFGKGQHVGVLVGRRNVEKIDPQLLRDTYLLSAKEADLCSILLTGKSPEEIAQKQGKSVRTIRNQIQAVYAKTGVTSAGELADALHVFRLFGVNFDTTQKISA